MVVTFGIDVHPQYQAGISFSAARRQGYQFAFVKASEGTGFTLPVSSQWVRSIRAAGMQPGMYHWITAGNGRAQAQTFWRLVQAAGGPSQMMIALDCEANSSYADIVAWKNEWNRLSGGHPFVVYTGSWWWGARGWNGAAITPYLWHSQYVFGSSYSSVSSRFWTPGYGGWPRATLLQYSSRASVGGRYPVDVNAFQGSLPELQAKLLRGQTSTSSISIAPATKEKKLVEAVGASRTQTLPVDGIWHGIRWNNNLYGTQADPKRTRNLEYAAQIELIGLTDGDIVQGRLVFNTGGKRGAVVHAPAVAVKTAPGSPFVYAFGPLTHKVFPNTSLALEMRIVSSRPEPGVANLGQYSRRTIVEIG